MEAKFQSAGGETVTGSEVVRAIMEFMRAAPKFSYRITIGTDSEVEGGMATEFVTAVVVHRIGNGGRYFWRRVHLGKFHTVRDRIIKEVLISLEAAKQLLGELERAAKGESLDWEFEIHADIGKNGKTSAMIREVVAMIRANNFSARTKPGSYAASCVADRHV